MTWNIEWFPKNGQATVDSVSTIIQALDMDLYAFQEISDTSMFKQMVNDMDGYEYYFLSSWFGGLAYVYQSDHIEINSIYEIYTEQPFWRPFPRSPMLMELTYQGQDYYIINNHFKCCGDAIMDLSDPWDEETRRFDASNLLIEYINLHLPDENVIVLGDLNDVLTDVYENNVFQTILDDEINYLFADIEIANGSNSGWSYPSWPSHIDHIFITNELLDSFGNNNSIIQTIEIDNYMDGGFNAYNEIISDHLFQISESENVNISIYNMNGQLIETIVNEEMNPGSYSVSWNAKNVSSDLYFYRLTTGNKTGTKKMILIK